MAQPVDFPGTNRVLTAPAGRDDVAPLRAFTNGAVCFTCWQLTDEELGDILSTGRVYLSIFSGGTMPPACLGSEDTIRDLVADYGGTFPHSETAPPAEVLTALGLAVPAVLPRNKAGLSLEHNPQRALYQSVEQYLEYNDLLDLTPEERAAAIERGELWTLHWYPDTPVGFCWVGASTFEALILAAASED